jgi:hypothetical protein
MTRKSPRLSLDEVRRYQALKTCDAARGVQHGDELDEAARAADRLLDQVWETLTAAWPQDLERYHDRINRELEAARREEEAQ